MNIQFLCYCSCKFRDVSFGSPFCFLVVVVVVVELFGFFLICVVVAPGRLHDAAQFTFSCAFFLFMCLFVSRVLIRVVVAAGRLHGTVHRPPRDEEHHHHRDADQGHQSAADHHADQQAGEHVTVTHYSRLSHQVHTCMPRLL